MNADIKNQDGSISNPELYMELLKPHSSLEVANDKLEKFRDEFRELRKKYSIPDLVLIARSIYMDQGEECDMISTMNCGNAALVFPLIDIAWQSEWNRISKILNQSSTNT